MKKPDLAKHNALERKDKGALSSEEASRLRAGEGLGLAVAQ